MRFDLLLLTFVISLLQIFFSAQDVSGAQVRLAWNPSSDPLVTGYRIYYGKTSEIYTSNIDAGNRTEYTVTELEEGMTYFFACTAYTASGAESNSTNEVSYTVSGGATPSPVDVGGGGGGCFIATAAYGSMLAPEVETLREFRDRYLMTNRPGRVLVNWYYRVSPPVAAFIAKHESLKTAMRWGLTPVVYGVKYPVSVPVTILLFAALVSLRRTVKRK